MAIVFSPNNTVLNMIVISCGTIGSNNIRMFWGKWEPYLRPLGKWPGTKAPVVYREIWFR